MGFYVANEKKAVAEEPRLCRQAKQGTPLKKSRLEFFSTSHSRAGFSVSQPVEPHREERPTPTITASGVRYYGYRYYSPGLGRWLSRDPIGEAVHFRDFISRIATTNGQSNNQKIPSSVMDLVLGFSPDVPSYLRNQFLNEYNFCISNPLRYNDIDGEMFGPIIDGAIIVAVVVGIIWMQIEGHGEAHESDVLGGDRDSALSRAMEAAARIARTARRSVCPP